MMGTPHRMLPASALNSGGASGTRTKMQGKEGVAPGMGRTERSQEERWGSRWRGICVGWREEGDR